MTAHPSPVVEASNPSPKPYTCTAHRSNGNPCRAPAMKGGRVCVAHGGKAPQVRAAAERRLAEGKALRHLARLGIEAPDDVAPSAALHEALRGAVGDYRAARRAVAEVPLEGNELPAMVAVYERTADRLARVARSALDAGLAERLTNVAEADAVALRDALTRAMAFVGLALDDREPLMQALAVELRRPVLQLQAGAA